MSENKRFYWLKLKDDFFATREIKKLRRIAGGDTYTIVYLKMQLLSIKKEGLLIYEGTEKSLAEQLSIELDEDEDNVKMTLAFLEQNKLIEQLSEDEFLLNRVPETIGSETGAAERMRAMRERRNIVTSQLPEVKERYTERERREERKEIEREKELEREKDIVDAEASTVTRKNDNEVIVKREHTPYQEIVNLYNETCGSELPKVQVVSDPRKRAMKSIWRFAKEDINLLKTVFNKAIASDFASGRSGTWTSCNFDWLIKQKNAIKVLEGNYDNKGSGPGGKPPTMEQQMKSEGVQDFLNS